MSVTFRNVDVDPHAPVETWPYEAIVTVIERGTISDWLLLTRAIDDDPWGPVARQVEEYLSYESPYGVGPLLTRAVERGRRQAEESERREVAQRVGALISRSGLTTAELASRVGTSRSRLSTYRTGRVVPSAAMLCRIERVVERVSQATSVAPEQ